MERQRLHTPINAGAVLNNILDQYGLSKSLSRHRVIHLWPKIARKAIARHSRIERITENVIHVAVDSSVWMNEIAALKHILLAKINECLGPGIPKFEDIRFYQRSRGFHKDESITKPVEETLDESDLRTIRSILEPVEDDTVKSLLTRLIEKDLKLKKRRNVGKTLADLD